MQNEPPATVVVHDPRLFKLMAKAGVKDPQHWISSVLWAKAKRMLRGKQATVRAEIKEAVEQKPPSDETPQVRVNFNGQRSRYIRSMAEDGESPEAAAARLFDEAITLREQKEVLEQRLAKSITAAAKIQANAEVLGGVAIEILVDATQTSDCGGNFRARFMDHMMSLMAAVGAVGGIDAMNRLAAVQAELSSRAVNTPIRGNPSTRPIIRMKRRQRVVTDDGGEIRYNKLMMNEA